MSYMSFEEFKALAKRVETNLHEVACLDKSDCADSGWEIDGYYIEDSGRGAAEGECLLVLGREEFIGSFDEMMIELYNFAKESQWS